MVTLSVVLLFLSPPRSRHALLAITPASPVTLAGADGFYAHNSTYKLGIIKSSFFTEVNVIGVTNPDTEWSIGEFVRGEVSGAIGLVEEGSETTTLLLSNVVGEFAPGEDITQGDKSSRIYREGEVAGFQFFDKGTGNNTVDLSADRY